MRSTVHLLLSRTGVQPQRYSRVALHSASFVLQSRTVLQHQPCSRVDPHSATFVRFYTSHDPIVNDDRSGIWHGLKTYFGFDKWVTKQAVCITVPESKAYVIEREGKYAKTLTTGTHYVHSTMDKIAYVHSLVEEAVSISDQQAITKDGVFISVDGFLCIKIVDPKLASYAAHDPMNCLMLLAKTYVGRESSKMTLDQINRGRDTLNEKIMMRINNVAKDWGMACVHCEIRDISLPPLVKEAEEMLAEVERKVRAQLIEAGIPEDEANAQARAMSDYAYDCVARAKERAKKV